MSMPLLATVLALTSVDVEDCVQHLVQKHLKVVLNGFETIAVGTFVNGDHDEGLFQSVSWIKFFSRPVDSILSRDLQSMHRQRYQNTCSDLQDYLVLPNSTILGT